MLRILGFNLNGDKTDVPHRGFSISIESSKGVLLNKTTLLK